MIGIGIGIGNGTRNGHVMRIVIGVELPEEAATQGNGMPHSETIMATMSFGTVATTMVRGEAATQKNDMLGGGTATGEAARGIAIGTNRTKDAGLRPEAGIGSESQGTTAPNGWKGGGGGVSVRDVGSFT